MLVKHLYFISLISKLQLEEGVWIPQIVSSETQVMSSWIKKK